MKHFLQQLFPGILILLFVAGCQQSEMPDTPVYIIKAYNDTIFSAYSSYRYYGRIDTLEFDLNDDRAADATIATDIIYGFIYFCALKLNARVITSCDSTGYLGGLSIRSFIAGDTISISEFDEAAGDNIPLFLQNIDGGIPFPATSSCAPRIAPRDSTFYYVFDMDKQAPGRDRYFAWLKFKAIDNGFALVVLESGCLTTPREQLILGR